MKRPVLFAAGRQYLSGIMGLYQRLIMRAISK